jgi:hypothetical protein
MFLDTQAFKKYEELLGHPRFQPEKIFQHANAFPGKKITRLAALDRTFPCFLDAGWHHMTACGSSCVATRRTEH